MGFPGLPGRPGTPGFAGEKGQPGGPGRDGSFGRPGFNGVKGRVQNRKQDSGTSIQNQCLETAAFGLYCYKDTHWSMAVK